MWLFVRLSLLSDSEDEDVNHNDDDEFYTESQVGDNYSMVSPDPDL